MALSDLFVVASIPVAKVLLVTAVGSFLALDHINILGEDKRKHMNNNLCRYWGVLLQILGSLCCVDFVQYFCCCAESSGGEELRWRRFLGRVFWVEKISGGGLGRWSWKVWVEKIFWVEKISGD
ncbi:hypothetical protein U1Q18_036935 [Sarracenia purpurea var. burkii]